MKGITVKEALLKDFAELSGTAVQFERLARSCPSIELLPEEMQEIYIERKKKLKVMQASFEEMLKELADIVFKTY